jgi:hypothetical protein
LVSVDIGVLALPRRERLRDGLPEGAFVCFASRQRQFGLPIGISASGRTMSVCQLMSFSIDLNVIHLRHRDILFGPPFEYPCLAGFHIE